MLHAEAMLFVNDGQPQILKRNIVLKKRVSPDDKLQFPARQGIEC